MSKQFTTNHWTTKYYGQLQRQLLPSSEFSNEVRLHKQEFQQSPHTEAKVLSVLH